jgi:Protein of unknown function (DUF3396)
VEPPQPLYKQSATHFALPLYLRAETHVDGRLIADLADTFLSTLLFPTTQPTSLWTKRPAGGAKLNMGEFTGSRWKTAQRKLLSNEYAVVHIEAVTPDFPNQKISFGAQVNLIGGDEFPIKGMWNVTCSVSYLRHLAAAPAKIDALLQLAKRAWNDTPGGPAYGYGNLAFSIARPLFDPNDPRPPRFALPPDVEPPAERVHAVPIAYVGSDIELNLENLYGRDRGIKGAFWANFLSAPHVAMAGGEATLKTKLNGMRLERLEHGGLLIVATDSPLPEDTHATRERFWRLDEALQPAFISRDETSEGKRGMLSYFYRERPPVR